MPSMDSVPPMNRRAPKVAAITPLHRPAARPEALVQAPLTRNCSEPAAWCGDAKGRRLSLLARQPI